MEKRKSGICSKLREERRRKKKGDSDGEDDGQEEEEEGKGEFHQAFLSIVLLS